MLVNILLVIVVVTIRSKEVRGVAVLKNPNLYLYLNLEPILKKFCLADGPLTGARSLKKV